MHFVKIFIVYTRGDQFRPEFALIGEVKSVLPNHVRVLTTTATKSTLKVVQSKLFLQSPIVVSQPPERYSILTCQISKRSLLQI